MEKVQSLTAQDDERVHKTCPKRLEHHTFIETEDTHTSKNSEQPAVTKNQTPGLSHQCSTTKLWQPDNHQPPQSSTYVFPWAVALTLYKMIS